MFLSFYPVEMDVSVLFFISIFWGNQFKGFISFTRKLHAQMACKLQHIQSYAMNHHGHKGQGNVQTMAQEQRNGRHDQVEDAHTRCSFRQYHVVKASRHRRRSHSHGKKPHVRDNVRKPTDQA